MYKILFKIAVIILLPFCIQLWANSKNEKRLVQDIAIEYTDTNMFITDENIRRTIFKDPQAPHSLGFLRINEIEEALDNNHMIEKAEVFYTIDGILSAKIKQRDPIARVYEDKEAYYMDSKGKKMPLSSVFSARVPLVRGHSSKYWDTTFLLMTFIKEDKWLRENITEVQVLPNGEYSFLMRVPHFKVFFGKFENEQLKIANLKAFYKQLEKTDALDNYSSVSLKYKNQVICKQ